MSDIKRIDISSRMSQVVIHENKLFTAGIVASDPNTDVAAQTGQILDTIDGYLAASGSDKSKILTANIWLSSIKHYEEMNEVWDTWVDESNPPVRACVESRLASPKYKIEIQISAVI